jgi:hypothetical protein
MNASDARSLAVSGSLTGNRVATAAALAWKAALREAARALAKARAAVRRRWRAVLEDLRPYDCDTVQKRKVHRESWLAELEQQELELRAVPATARAVVQEGRDWAARIAAVEARYEVMRGEFRDLRSFSLLERPLDRNGLPRTEHRFGSAAPAEAAASLAGSVPGLGDLKRPAA